jgi:uncharacterized membrane protein (UPF0127 family)
VLSFILALTLATAHGVPTSVLPDGSTLHLELALSDQERQLGLMFRDSLPADHGMLFVFDKDEPWPFWMKNTFIPLDLVWLDAAGRVVEVRSDVPPCHADPCQSYQPAHPARAVLEVNAGASAAHHVTAGAQLRFVGVDGYPAAEGKR